MTNKIQITLALLKPDVALNPIAVKAITDKILSRNLRVIRKKTLHWTQDDSGEFYRQHHGRFFYRRLIEYTTCGPIIAMLLAGTKGIQEWRNLMGPTKTFKAKLSHPYTIRGEYGLTDTRNSSHGSDSQAAVSEEIKSIFPDFDVTTWKGSKKVGADTRTNNAGIPTPSHALKSQDLNHTLGLQDTWSKYYEGRRVDHIVDWFIHYRDLKDTLLPLIQKSSRQRPIYKKLVILDLGCGNSMIGPELAKEFGEESEVYGVDFVRDALLRLQYSINEDESFDSVRNFSLVHCDITQTMPFDTDSISTVIDKGTTDSILRQPQGPEMMKETLHNVFRVLHKGGVFIKITDEEPDIQIDMLSEAVNTMDQASRYEISCKELESESACDGYFIYTVTKS